MGGRFLSNLECKDKKNVRISIKRPYFQKYVKIFDDIAKDYKINELNLLKVTNVSRNYKHSEL